MPLKASSYSDTPFWAGIFPGRKDIILSWDEPLSRHTTFRVGGPVRCLARPGTESALVDLVREARTSSIPFVLLGGGSNVLAPDAPWETIAIQPYYACGKIRPIGGNGRTFYVGSGVSLSSWVRFAMRNELSGSECLVGIPGLIGGALVMNAGAGEGCIADLLLWIDILDARGNRRRIGKSDLAVTYRSLGVPEEWVILGAALRLHPGSKGSIRSRMAEAMRRRKLTQPLGWPSAGCIFKNPPEKLSAGALIDRAGLKGLRIGDAEVSHKHANWIINKGQAKASDIVALIEHIEARILGEFGIRLEREIRILHDEEKKV